MRRMPATRGTLLIAAAMAMVFGGTSAACGIENGKEAPPPGGDWTQWGGSPSRNNTPEAKNLPESHRQLGNRIAESALAKGAEERQVLAHLRWRRAAPFAERARADRPLPFALALVEVLKVQRQPSDGG